jgi:preprotein translocase subunit SecF
MAILSRFDYNYDFMGQRYIGMIGSISLAAISLISLLTIGLNYGIDFTGGTLIEISYKDSVELQPIRTVLHSNGFGDAVVQNFGTTHDVLIRLGIHKENSNEHLSNRIIDLLRKDRPDVQIQRVEFVGPQVGNELVEKGGLALILTMIGILIYVAIRYEFRFALGAVLALLHDPIIVLGFFSVFRIEFDLTVVAAILAVIGYSINDTVVVYDRIRDNFVKLRKQSVIEIMNVSINQTLSRTVMTSVTTLIVVAILFFVGGELIHGFSLALIIGIVVGTYSSIYVASAFALVLGVSRNDLMPVQKEGAELGKRGIDNT